MRADTQSHHRHRTAPKEEGQAGALAAAAAGVLLAMAADGKDRLPEISLWAVEAAATAGGVLCMRA